MKPIAWMSPDGKFSTTEGKLFSIPLYTAPRELDDDLIEAIALNYVGDDDELDFIGFARAILKKASEE
jgi:hypothetical protein